MRRLVVEGGGRGELDVAELERGLDAEVGLARVSLGKEELEVVGVSGFEPEFLGAFVEVHGGGLLGVDAAEVDGEAVVDEDPDVVVSGEGEDEGLVAGLGVGVGELGLDLVGEVEVVGARGGPAEGSFGGSEAHAVGGPEVLGPFLGEVVGPVGLSDELDGVEPGGVDARDVAEPLVEGFLGMDLDVRAPAPALVDEAHVEDGFAVGSEFVHDEVLGARARVGLHVGV